MKHIKITMLALLISGFVSVNAQTNTPAVSLDKPKGDTETKTWVTELTFSGSGVTTSHGTEFGVDFSYETNPFKKLPSLWVEVIQGVAWAPTFAGSTDFTSEWAFPIYKDVFYFNTGWNVGVTYDEISKPLYRTGPEANLQYFFGNSTFIYGGIVFDAFVSRGDIGIRPQFGIGWTF